MTPSLKIPFNEEMERALLGSALIDYKVLDEIIIDEELFYIDKHKEIYEAINILQEQGSPIDLKTVFSKLKSNTKVTVDYLLSIAEQTPTSGHANYYALELRKLSNLRKVARIAKEMYNDILSEDIGDVDELIFNSVNKLTNITQNADNGGFKSLNELTKENISKQEKIAQTGKTERIMTMFPSIDRLTGGLCGGNLVFIGARPSIGKTAFALNLALRMGKNSHGAISVFSMEMGGDAICYRMMAGLSQINNDDFKNGNAYKNQSKKLYALDEITKKYNIYVNDKSNNTVAKIKKNILELRKEHGLKAVVIDYLQLIKGSRKFTNKNEEISEISRDLKNLAMELNVPIIVLSQLSRDIEKRDNKRPRMSDLRDSGSIEQDADIIMMLSRDDYQDVSSQDVSIINVDVLKDRDGSIGALQLYFDKPHSWFSEIVKDIRQ